MKKYKSSAELKAMAKEQLFGSYGTAVSALLVVSGFSLVASFLPSFLIGVDSVFSMIIYYLVSFLLNLILGIFASGTAFLYLKLVCGQRISTGDVFYGFRSHADKALLIRLVVQLVNYICVVPSFIFNYLFTTTKDVKWMLCMSVSLVIGLAVAVIITLMLSQSFYLLQDFPDYSARELLQMSCRIMKGHKGRLFYIQLSFFPLFLLGILSCCIAFLWIIPYMNATLADFYMDLVANSRQEEGEKA